MVRFGIIGTNFIVDLFLKAGMNCEGFKLEGVYSRTKEKAEEYGRRHGAALFFDSLEAMADCESIDAVYIASPNSCHFSQSMMMLEKGKHVLCEKAAASNSRELEMMLAAAKQHNVVFLEAMRLAFDPGFLKIQELMQELGTLRRASLRYCQYSSRYDAFREGEILNAFNPALSNGALMDIGVYVVHAMGKLFGLPQSVQSQSILLSNGVEGAGSILAGYEGMAVQLSYSKISGSLLGSEIEGEDGNLLIDTIGNPRELVLKKRGREAAVIQIDKRENTMEYELTEFIRKVQSGGAEDDNEYSLIAMKVMDEVRRQNGIVFPADQISE